MAIVLTDDKHYKAIADRIRQYRGDDSTWLPETMPIGVELACIDQRDNGFAEGRTAGFNEGVVAGRVEGQREERDSFWSVLQKNGKRTDYSYAFYNPHWTATNFRPVYDMKPTTASYMFANWNGHAARSFDLVAVLEECGVTLDFSNCTNFNRIFNSCTDISRVGDLDIRNATNLSVPFAYSGIETIEKMIVDTNTPLSTVFASYGALRNIAFEGEIGQNCDMEDCSKLTAESIRNVVNALTDMTSGKTVTFSKEAVEAAFTEDEWAALVATRPNWIVSLV